MLKLCYMRVCSIEYEGVCVCMRVFDSIKKTLFTPSLSTVQSFITYNKNSFYMLRYLSNLVMSRLVLFFYCFFFVSTPTILSEVKCAI